MKIQKQFIYLFFIFFFWGGGVESGGGGGGVGLGGQGRCEWRSEV